MSPDIEQQIDQLRVVGLARLAEIGPALRRLETSMKTVGAPPYPPIREANGNGIPGVLRRPRRGIHLARGISGAATLGRLCWIRWRGWRRPPYPLPGVQTRPAGTATPPAPPATGTCRVCGGPLTGSRPGG